MYLFVLPFAVVVRETKGVNMIFVTIMPSLEGIKMKELRELESVIKFAMALRMDEERFQDDSFFKETKKKPIFSIGKCESII